MGKGGGEIREGARSDKVSVGSDYTIRENSDRSEFGKRELEQI